MNYSNMTDAELRAERTDAQAEYRDCSNAIASKSLESRMDAVDAEFARRDQDAVFLKAYAASGFNPATTSPSAELRALDSWGRNARPGDATELRAYSISGGASTGADTVPVKVGGLITPEVYTAKLEQLVRRVVTSNGEPLNTPRRAAHQAMTPVAELATYATSNGSIATVNTTPVKLGAISTASAELVADSAINVAALITGGFEDSWATTVEAAVVNGTNVNGSGITGETAASTTAAVAAVTADELIAHYFEGLTKPYRDRAVWMFNSSTISAIRSLKDSNGDYLLRGLEAGMPSLFGRPVIEVPSFADMATGAKFGALVDPTAVLLHVVRGLQIVRSDEYGFDSDLIAWKGTVRTDAAVADAAGVAVIANA